MFSTLFLPAWALTTLPPGWVGGRTVSSIRRTCPKAMVVSSPGGAGGGATFLRPWRFASRGGSRFSKGVMPSSDPDNQRNGKAKPDMCGRSGACARSPQRVGNEMENKESARWAALSHVGLFQAPMSITLRPGRRGRLQTLSVGGSQRPPRTSSLIGTKVGLPATVELRPWTWKVMASGSPRFQEKGLKRTPHSRIGATGKCTPNARYDRLSPAEQDSRAASRTRRDDRQG